MCFLLNTFCRLCYLKNLFEYISSKQCGSTTKLKDVWLTIYIEALIYTLMVLDNCNDLILETKESIPINHVQLQTVKQHEGVC